MASIAAQPTYLREAGQQGSIATNFGYQIPFPNIPEVGLGVDRFKNKHRNKNHSKLGFDIIS